MALIKWQCARPNDAAINQGADRESWHHSSQDRNTAGMVALDDLRPSWLLTIDTDGVCILAAYAVAGDNSEWARVGFVASYFTKPDSTIGPMTCSGPRHRARAS